jgi:protein-S-isoprenylcysteine O-methyltransferase Ste14
MSVKSSQPVSEKPADGTEAGYPRPSTVMYVCAAMSVGMLAVVWASRCAKRRDRARAIDAADCIVWNFVVVLISLIAGASMDGVVLVAKLLTGEQVFLLTFQSSLGNATVIIVYVLLHTISLGRMWHARKHGRSWAYPLTCAPIRNGIIAWLERSSSGLLGTGPARKRD